MRTTLDIDDDVLMAAREIARRRRRSVGSALSDMARQGLLEIGERAERNGVPLFRGAGPPRIVTQELVDSLRDEPA